MYKKVWYIVLEVEVELQISQREYAFSEVSLILSACSSFKKEFKSQHDLDVTEEDKTVYKVNSAL